MIRDWGILVFILFLGSGAARGAGLRDLDGGWLLEPPDEVVVLTGETARLDEGRAWWVGGGVSRLFGLEELPVSGLDCGYRTPAWSAGFRWQRTGRTLFVEDRAEALWRLGRGPRVGFRMGLRTWMLTGWESRQAWDPALELTVGPGSPWGIRFTWHVFEAPEWHGRAGRRELVRATWVGAGAGVAVAVDHNGDGVPAVGLHGLWRIDRRVGVGIRADPVTGVLGPCLTVAAQGLMIRTSHLIHPALGITHRVSFGLGEAKAAPW